MAKKKEEKETKDQKDDSISQIYNLLAEIEKDYGKGIARSGDDLLNNPPMEIPFSPSLDTIIGSVPEGSWVLASGNPKGGKTTALLSFCANCQKEEYGNRHIMILSVEHRLDQMMLSGIKDLKTDPKYLTFVESTKGRILNSIDFLNIGLLFLKNVTNGVLLIDSVSALTSPKVLQDGIGSSDMGRNNINFSQFVDIAVPIAKSNHNIILMVAQNYANVSGYGGAWKIKVPTKGKYQADIILEIKKFEFEYGNGESEPPTSQIVTWLCRKSNKLSPMREINSYIKFGIGIDRTRELLLKAQDYGLVTKGGSWLTFNFISDDLKKNTEYEEKDVKIQGESNASELLEQNPLWIDELNKQIKQILGK